MALAPTLQPAPSVRPEEFPAAPEQDYWDEARRPLASLLFLLPLLAGYEAATVLLAGTTPAGLRNGADAWIRGWLLGFGVEIPWLLPGAVAATLLIQHWFRRDAAQFRVSTFLGMLAESLMFALLLIVAGQTLHSVMGPPPAAMIAKWSVSPMQLRVISSVGAGLYEEFLFRLLLVPLLIFGLRQISADWVASIIAVAASSLLFAAAHYLPSGSSALSPVAYIDAIEIVAHHSDLWYGFLFRGVAGAAFGTLFVLRGFGVTVGAHACYDVLVGFMASITA
jgi:hypothetical protein